MGLDGIVKGLATAGLVAAGIYAAVQLTPLIWPYYASNSAQLTVAATGGAGAGYIVGSATNSKNK